ncbi:TlpA disulfide reductase family protein [Limnohabitans sp.]|jgi:thiol-disulfide isomerase/thioredoxin|uniref:TlpA family protein disulfide reductase n=1 Tax=Limnohabitans sp. TaxID=1907725 RepID=UPI00286EC077|nr:TlpA disulfide reductase family protein [Limnohabitans sp.]
MTINANRRTTMFAGVATLAAIAGVAVAWKRQAGQEAVDIASDVMQSFWSAEFDTPTGEPLAMASFQGRPLVINFWATWCTPCVEEMPLIDAFFRENKEKGWQVLGLAIDQPSRVRQFLSQFPVSYKIGLAGLNGTELAKQLGNEVGGLPFTVVLDGQGHLIQEKVGKLTPDDIRKWAI